jgi:hypothetical protein
MDPGFAGDVVEFYHRYRHGYPAGVIDVLADLLGLGPADVVLDPTGPRCGSRTATGPARCAVSSSSGSEPG